MASRACLFATVLKHLLVYNCIYIAILFVQMTLVLQQMSHPAFSQFLTRFTVFKFGGTATTFSGSLPYNAMLLSTSATRTAPPSGKKMGGGKGGAKAKKILDLHGTGLGNLTYHRRYKKYSIHHKILGC